MSKNTMYANRFKKYSRIDLPLLGAMLMLVLLGLGAIYSAVGLFYLKKQVFAFSIGFFLFMLFMTVDYRFVRKYSEIIYFIAIFILIAVLNFGSASSGVHRWIAVGDFSFQPSEIAKIALIIIMAKFFELRKNKLNSLLQIAPSFVLVAIPFFLIFKQPDLGTAVTILIVFSAMALWAGMRFTVLLLLASPIVSILVLYVLPVHHFWSWFGYLACLFVILRKVKIPRFDAVFYFMANVIAGIFSPFLWNSLKLYQQQRILSFINPDLDPFALGARYHVMKSITAVGSGGFFGKGFLKGPLTHLGYVPEQHTDFIISIIGEELGFIGTTLVLILSVFIIYRLIMIAVNSEVTFGSLLVIGTATLFMFQMFVNIGMAIGILPVVGIPLPLVSFGGTSLICLLIMLGIAQSVAINKKGLSF